MPIADRTVTQTPTGYVRLPDSAQLPNSAQPSAPGAEYLTPLTVQPNIAPLRDSLGQQFSSDIYARQLYPDSPYAQRAMPIVASQLQATAQQAATTATVTSVQTGTPSTPPSSSSSGSISTFVYEGAWNATTKYFKGEEVTYNDNFWLALTTNINSVPSTSNSNWVLVGPQNAGAVADSQTFQGQWNSGTAYLTGQEVAYPTVAAGNIYLALQASTGITPGTNNAYWQLLGPSSASEVLGSQIYKGQWVAGTYLTGQEVSNLGNYWLCTPTSGGSTTDEPGIQPLSSNWTLVGPLSATDLEDSEVFVGYYSTSIVYDPGNQVIYSGNFYLCVAENGPWVANTYYSIGEEATYSGTAYTCTVANSDATFTIGHWSALASLPTPPNATFWQLMGPTTGSQQSNTIVLVGPWSPTLFYDVNDEVTYNGNYWLCMVANTNQVPTTGSTYWQEEGTTPVAGPVILPWSSTTPYQVGNEVVYTSGFGGSGNTGALAPTAVSQTGGGVTWANPANAEGSSGFATVSLTPSSNVSQYLNLTGFSFSGVPSGATITGIVISINPQQASGTSAIYGSTIELVGTTGQTTNHCPSYPGGGWPATTSYGSSADTWGVTAADLYGAIQAGTLGVLIGCQCTQAPGSGAGVELNTVTMTVYYVTTGTGTTNVYKCSIANTNVVPTNATYWTLVAPATLDAVNDGSTFRRVGSVNSSNLTTTDSYSANSVSGAVVTSVTSTVNFSNTATQLASLTITTAGGIVLLDLSFEGFCNNATSTFCSFTLYQGTNTGTALASLGNVYLDSTSLAGRSIAICGVVDFSPGATQQYTLYGTATSGGTTPQADGIYFRAVNLKA